MAIQQLCSIPDCGKFVHARDYCDAHYRRWIRHGAPLAGRVPPISKGALCSVQDCGADATKREWCDLHYRRWLAHGSPLWRPEKTMNGEPLRYLREVVLAYDGDECLSWPYGTASGRATVHLGGRCHIVSRLVCEEEHGPPPTPKHQSAHSCGKGHLRCVAKRHLSWKTHTENMADKVAHGTAPRGENNHFAKLTEAQVREIRSLRSKMPQTEVAKSFGVSQSLISLIQNGKNWASLA